MSCNSTSSYFWGNVDLFIILKLLEVVKNNLSDYLVLKYILFPSSEHQVILH